MFVCLFVVLCVCLFLYLFACFGFLFVCLCVFLFASVFVCVVCSFVKLKNFISPDVICVLFVCVFVCLCVYVCCLDAYVVYLLCKRSPKTTVDSEGKYTLEAGEELEGLDVLTEGLVAACVCVCVCVYAGTSQQL